MHYSFTAEREQTVRDVTGRGRDAALVGDAHRDRGAVYLDGDGDFVDAGPIDGFDPAGGATVMLWARPESGPQGGLVCWNIDGSYPGCRLVLTVDTYHGGARTIGVMSDGTDAAGFQGFESLPLNTWSHVAYTLDGQTITTYFNGIATAQLPQDVLPDVSGVAMWIGKSLGLGQSYFAGWLDEVRIYDHALAPGDVLGIYKRDAAQRGHDMSRFNRPQIETAVYPAPAKIGVTVDTSAMAPLPDGAVVRATLGKQTIDAPAARQVEIIFDAEPLAVGDVAITAQVVGVGDTADATAHWPGRPAMYEGIVALNNLCWQLADVDHPDGDITFNLPVRRWVFVRTQGDAAVHLGDDRLQTPEAMRHLDAGRHVLRVEGDAQRVIVRAIPALHHGMYGADPWLKPQGPFDWDFLDRYGMLDNINVMVAGLDHYRRGDAFDRLPQWHALGKQWVSYKALPWDMTSPQQVYDFWTDGAGFNHPLTAGVMIDEANGGELEIYDHLTEAVHMMERQPEFEGKAVYPWCDVLYGRDRSTRFAQTCLEGGADFCWEVYFHEEQTRAQMQNAMRQFMTSHMPKWEDVFPGITHRMVLVFNNCAAPPESVNINPSVDYRAVMDEQMHYIATHPAYFGIGGTQWYHSGYSTEESLRLIAQINRHYAIEGRTDRYITDPYRLAHIRNPDFADGTNHWTVEGDAQTGSLKGYGERVQGRFLGGIGERVVRPVGIGDTYLMMTRTSNRPNIAHQTIDNLTPGRLYSLKLITADRDMLDNSVTEKQTHALRIDIADAEVIDDPSLSFQCPVPQARPFNDFTWSVRYWMAYHHRVFRATGETAELTISDWATESEPGGPIGQRLMYNFVEVQPYLPREPNHE